MDAPALSPTRPRRATPNRPPGRRPRARGRDRRWPLSAPLDPSAARSAATALISRPSCAAAGSTRMPASRAAYRSPPRISPGNDAAAWASCCAIDICASTSPPSSRPAGRRGRSPAAGRSTAGSAPPSARDHLPTCLRSRRPCGRSPSASAQGPPATPAASWPQAQGLVRFRFPAIEQPPADVSTRQTFGHWEADLLILRRAHGPANLASTLERQTRFTLLLPNPDRRSQALVGRIGRALRGLPAQGRQTITFDRGIAFAAYGLPADRTGTEAFCDPHSPWRKGAVENANGRIRRLLPGERNLAEGNADELAG